MTHLCNTSLRIEHTRDNTNVFTPPIMEEKRMIYRQHAHEHTISDNSWSRLDQSKHEDDAFTLRSFQENQSNTMTHHYDAIIKVNKVNDESLKVNT